MFRQLITCSSQAIGKSMLAICLCSIPNSAQAAATFLDLTAKEYKGADSDLSGLGLSKFGVGCDENGTYRVGDASGISWQNQSDHGGKGLKSYTIHFRLKDRRGSVIHEEDFVYRQEGPQGSYPYRGRVFWSDPEYSCVDRNAIIFSKRIDLSFVTVEYWVSKLVWMKESQFSSSQLQPDNIAFSVSQHLHKPKVKAESDTCLDFQTCSDLCHQKVLAGKMDAAGACYIDRDERFGQKQSP